MIDFLLILLVAYLAYHVVRLNLRVTEIQEIFNYQSQQLRLMSHELDDLYGRNLKRGMDYDEEN